jgi:hypothetical protein
MMIPNDMVQFLIEAWDEKVARLEAERDALRIEVDALRQREAERIRFAGLSLREQKRVTSERLSDLFDQLAQLQHETRAALMPVER